MRSSISTLEKIAEQDATTDTSRELFLLKKTGLNLLAFTAGATAIGVSIKDMYDNGPGWNILWSGLGGTACVAGGKGLVDAVMTACKYLLELKEGARQDAFYCLGEKISAQATAVERKYGFPVKPADSLVYFDEPVVKQTARSPARLIDHIIIRDVESEKYRMYEAATHPDADRSYVDWYEGEFTIERFDEKKHFCFIYRGSIPDGLNKLMRSEGTELALLFNPCGDGFHEPSRDHGVTFEVERVIYPHP